MVMFPLGYKESPGEYFSKDIFGLRECPASHLFLKQSSGVRLYHGYSLDINMVIELIGEIEISTYPSCSTADLGPYDSLGRFHDWGIVGEIVSGGKGRGGEVMQIRN